MRLRQIDLAEEGVCNRVLRIGFQDRLEGRCCKLGLHSKVPNLSLHIDFNTQETILPCMSDSRTQVQEQADCT